MTLNSIEWIGSNAYAYPLLEVLHIIGIALLVGNLTLLELCFLGVLGGVDLTALKRVTLRMTLAGFFLVASSGVVMFLSQPQELLANSAFRVKLLLLGLAGGNALWFHARGGLGSTDKSAKAQVLLSLVLWVAVITAGRWIGYV